MRIEIFFLFFSLKEAPTEIMLFKTSGFMLEWSVLLLPASDRTRGPRGAADDCRVDEQRPADKKAAQEYAEEDSFLSVQYSLPA